MELYQYLTVESFVDIGKQSANKDVFIFRASNLMHLIPEEDYQYGLSILRKAIYLYEKENNISPEQTKSSMPFFRENSKVLIGPETGLFIFPLYENNELDKQTLFNSNQIITITWDYNKLAEYCLFENLFLLKGKYSEEQAINTFKEQLKTEYDKVFFTEEYTGFSRDSRFFSMLYNACLEVIKPEKAMEKEWRITAFKPLSDVEYCYHSNDLKPFISLEIPKECLKEINLQNREEQPLLYGTLAGFMKSIGLAPDIYLKGMQD